MSTRALAVRTIAIGALAAVLAGCGGDGKNLLGGGKRSPDEFAVYSRAPLTLPPDYGLRPPTPGSGPVASGAPRTDARNAMLGGRSDSGAGGGYVATAPAYGGGSAGAFSFDAAPTAAPPRTPPNSPGIDAMLVRTGAGNADPAIRNLINKETDILAEEDQSLVERLMWWGTTTDYGTVVDPVEERRRITENQALGRTITSGQTPTIERKKRALLEGIFD